MLATPNIDVTIVHTDVNSEGTAAPDNPGQGTRTNALLVVLPAGTVGVLIGAGFVDGGFTSRLGEWMDSYAVFCTVRKTA